MRVHEIMSYPVITVTPDDTLVAVAEKLVRHRISAAPVVDPAGHVVGIVSEGDLLHRAETRTERRRSWWLELFTSGETLAQDYVKSHGRLAKDVMSRRVLSVHPDSSLADVADLLDRRGIKRVPVLDGGKLVGIISRADLVRAFVAAKTGRKGPEAARSDADIQIDLDAALQREAWASPLTVVTAVQDGVVQLLGLIRSADERDALVLLAGNVPGVRRVEDRLQFRAFAEI
ncbi:CBS domain-containing protein [Ancylobacter lacus]|uniref:CBS domain-containing protein n=1 Tax=Ancylobacter lacus TaxID=2579970 RepID=UPI001BD03953|nr:CBS domain-containing protein [Ancylobacter lacus]MBS7538979.1 CBS domain-containing protein [Ancylobacter lacus]